MSDDPTILRVHRTRSGTQTTLLNVNDLMVENAGYEESAVTWIEEMLANGEYDDSDRSSGVIVVYYPADTALLRGQYAAWRATQP